MERFRKNTRNTMLLMSIVMTILLIGYLLMIKNYEKFPSLSIDIISFQGGVLIGMTLLFLIDVFKKVRVLRDEELLKKLYIKEKDERRMMIMQKTGSIGINICILGLGISTIISGFFNETVFFTLLATTMFTALVKGVFKIYYYHKI